MLFQEAQEEHAPEHSAANISASQRKHGNTLEVTNISQLVANNLTMHSGVSNHHLSTTREHQ